MNLIKILLILSFSFFIIKIEAQQIPPHLNCVKINHLYRKACHNCYDPGVVPFGTFKQALDATRVVELDIYSHRKNATEA